VRLLQILLDIDANMLGRLPL